jgi:DNA-binding MarR family transcriptional regulator
MQEMIELFGAERRLQRRDQQSGGLTSTQMRALFVLDDADVVTAGQLAKSADLNPGSITSMLELLVKKGIVERRINARDQRSWLVSLTDEGRAAVAETRARWDAAWSQCLAELSEVEIASAVRAFRMISVTLDSL